MSCPSSDTIYRRPAIAATICFEISYEGSTLPIDFPRLLLLFRRRMDLVVTQHIYVPPCHSFYQLATYEFTTPTSSPLDLTRLVIGPTRIRGSRRMAPTKKDRPT
ncbi:hypothetical protein M413DRAFT_449982 [Hebeloma cylindrosporum]|uniref:Uncharacterized protein n=1 Tax=Hebeloma cylindrosporum TaxID=76867 RepID=A0A0C3BDT0_HEBCY|nr:hypothetical protein M413DRAFT_449982 [Hebeloma cylindrosporum h7]